MCKKLSGYVTYIVTLPRSLVRILHYCAVALDQDNLGEVIRKAILLLRAAVWADEVTLIYADGTRRQVLLK